MINRGSEFYSPRFTDQPKRLSRGTPLRPKTVRKLDPSSLSSSFSFSFLFKRTKRRRAIGYEPAQFPVEVLYLDQAYPGSYEKKIIIIYLLSHFFFS